MATKIASKRVENLGFAKGWFPKGWFPKGWFWRMFPRNEKPERGCIRAICSPGTKTGARVHSPNHPFTKPPFYLPVRKEGRVPVDIATEIAVICPALPFLVFLEFLVFLRSPCFFERFPSFPGVLGVRQGLKTLVLLVGFPCHSPKKQGREGRGESLRFQIASGLDLKPPAIWASERQ